MKPSLAEVLTDTIRRLDLIRNEIALRGGVIADELDDRIRLLGHESQDVLGRVYSEIHERTRAQE